MVLQAALSARFGSAFSLSQGMTCTRDGNNNIALSEVIAHELLAHACCWKVALIQVMVDAALQLHAVNPC
jgi:hypothetical protein